MFKWAAYPFVRISLCFILGIVLAAYWPYDRSPSLYVVILVWLFFIASSLAFRGEQFRRFKVFIGFWALLFSFLAGFVHLQSFKAANNPLHFQYLSTLQYYRAIVSSSAQEKANSYKLEVEIKEVQADGEWQPAIGKVLVYLAKDSTRKVPEYGSLLLIKGNPQFLKDPANPNEFNYKRFLGYKNIYHQHYIRPESWMQYDSEPPNILYAKSLKIREYFVGEFRKYVHSPQELAIAAALTIGVKDDLDSDIVDAYSASGAMHVLAVSGLHVGILLLILNGLLGSVKKLPQGKLIFAILIIVLLWLYAFITGLSASVLRAVTMFSMVIIAQAYDKKSNIYNTLAASAFLLLCYDPYLIMSVGFQLSYLAVVGIVYLQPKLYILWHTSHYWLDKIWAITCVSIAAQLATFPLAVLYYHQFPTYFMFSNLVIIPASFYILCNGLALLAVSWIDVLGEVVGWVLQWAIWLTNQFVFWVERLPYSQINGIYLETYQSWIIYLIILSLILLFYTRRFVWMVWAFVFVVAFSWSRIERFNVSRQQSYVLFHQIDKQSITDFVEGNTHHLLGDSVFLGNKDRFRFHVRPHLLMSAAMQIQSAEPMVRKWKNLELMNHQGKSFAFVRAQFEEETKGDTLKVNYLVLSNNSVRNLTELSSRFGFDTLIIDSSNREKLAEKIRKEAEKSDLPCYSVPHEGYLRLEL